MKVTIEAINAVEKKLNFEIPPERVREETEKMYHSLQVSTRIKGFRAGKAPRALIERQFGEQVAAEVGAHLVEESYAQAIEEHQLPVVTPPRVVAEKMMLGQPFRYSATVEVRPEVSVVNYEGIEVEKQVRQVQEKELEDALSRLAESFAQLHPVGDRAQVENGDVVRLDFAAFVNGKPIPGLQNKGRLIEMGKEIIFPGFQERLLGAKKGSVEEFSLPLPEDQASETPPNRQADFRVIVHELLHKEVPQLDDEFAKDHGECDTLAELREKVRQNLQQALERRTEAQLEETILTQLVDRNPVEVPPSLVREQERRMLIEAGILRPEEDLPAEQAALPEQLREEFSARARRQVQTFLLLDALAKQLNVVVSEEEIQKRIEEIITANGIERREQIVALYERPENHSSLERRLQQEKTLRLVTDKAQVKVVEKSVPEEEAGVAATEEKD
ncbi:MAG: trigger factor [Candidatus Binatia bacterium]